MDVDDGIRSIRRAREAANRRVRLKAISYESGDEHVPFLCECGRPGCTEVVRLSVTGYDRAKRKGIALVHPRHAGAAARGTG
jgi:hypothetical protein